MGPEVVWVSDPVDLGQDCRSSALRAVSTGHGDRPGHRRSDMLSDMCAGGTEAMLASIGFKLVTVLSGVTSSDGQEPAMGNLKKCWKV